MNKFIKENFWNILVSLFIVGMIAIISILAVNIHRNEEALKKARINEQALIEQCDAYEKESRVFKANYAELKKSNDSIIISLRETQKNLKIKNNELAGLQKMITEYSKKDTVVFRDTIFKDPTIYIDTTIGDKWISNRLELSYPNNICIDTKVKSDKNIILSTTKETIKPPKKCWIGRIFQRKQRVLKATVDEKNPYIESEQNIFIQVAD